MHPYKLKLQIKVTSKEASGLSFLPLDMEHFKTARKTTDAMTQMFLLHCPC